MRKSRLTIIFALLIFCGFHWWDPLAKWIGIGNDALKKGDVEEAEKAYNKAISVAPDSAEAQNNLGLAYYRAEDVDEAAKHFDKALSSKNPKVRSEALYNEGCMLMNAGKVREAAGLFKRALKLNPEDEDAKINLELAQRMLEQMPSQTPQPRDNQSTPQPSPQASPQPSPQASPQPSPQASPKDSQPSPRPNATPSPLPSPRARPEAQESPSPSPSPTPMGAPQTPQPAAQTTQEPSPVPTGMMSATEAARLLDALEEDEMEVLKRFHQLPPVDEKNVDKDW